MNPYTGQDFFGFFHTLWLRLFSGKSELASDELQLVTLLALSLACALLGVFLTLKKMTMLANSISHTVLLGIVMSAILLKSFSSELELSTPILFTASLLSGLLTTLLTHFFTHVMRLQEDASIGLVFTTLFALGIVLVTLFTKSAHIGIEAVMGNVDALEREDGILAALSLLISALFVFGLFKELKVTAFDPLFSKTLGFSGGWIDLSLMVVTASVAISAFKAIGVFLVLALLVAPPLTARLWTHRLGPLVGLSLVCAALASVIGVALSRHLLSVYDLPLSTGGIVVTLLGVGYAGSALFRIRRMQARRI